MSAASQTDPADDIVAMFEAVRDDLRRGDFGRVGLLDEALALPGDLKATFPDPGVKRHHYAPLQFLKALVALERSDFATAERHLEAAYGHAQLHERDFAFPWVIDRLKHAPPLDAWPNLEGVRHMLLQLNMTPDLSYEAALDAIQGPASVVEIGAMDGVLFDRLHRHITDKRWDAVLVEPIPDMCERLRRNYEGCEWVRCVNVAIAEATGPLTMMRIDPSVVQAGVSDWLLGISSALERPGLAYFAGAVLREVVRGLTFEDFTREFAIDRIDVLQIDTEGYDWRILKQVDLGRWRIGVLHVELIHTLPSERLEAFRALHLAGYAYTYDGMNLTAVLPAAG